jgi:phytoene/squalene synthetase
MPIYAIYGFVRCADEIVDTFHDFDKKALLDKFREDTYAAIEGGISLNPVLQAFQLIVNRYSIERELVDAFLDSMEMDLYDQSYTPDVYNKYIFGSAEVVGLMCLRVFCEGDNSMFERLRAGACSLGAAFQKVNFLRDLKSDYLERGRIYFPGVEFTTFDPVCKQEIENDIERDFDAAYQGILGLPPGARQGVYLAYVYYRTLFEKIKKIPAARIQEERVRVADRKKLALLAHTYFKFRMNALIASFF